MQEEHAKVFKWMGENLSPEMAMPFAPICKGTGLPRERVRFICRHLTRKGLLQFCRALWTDDGEPRGAGYGLSDAGWHEYWKDNAAIAAKP